MHGRLHLLVKRLLNKDAQPDRYLVTLTERICGPIRFSHEGWKSDGVQLLSVSLRRDRYEVMALMGEHDWIESDVGLWLLSQDRTRLEISRTLVGGQG